LEELEALALMVGVAHNQAPLVVVAVLDNLEAGTATTTGVGDLEEMA
jgi:N-acetyl-gamma-glutamylphosphate reductase